jgi:hypothetical protein
LDALGGAPAIVDADRFGTVSIESMERVFPELESLYAFRGPRATLSGLSLDPGSSLVVAAEALPVRRLCLAQIAIRNSPFVAIIGTEVQLVAL